MTWLKQNWFKLAFVLIGLITLIGVFYWFQLRPSNIKKECSKLLRGFGSVLSKDPDKEYQNCLKEHGL